MYSVYNFLAIAFRCVNIIRGMCITTAHRPEVMLCSRIHLQVVMLLGYCFHEIVSWDDHLRSMHVHVVSIQTVDCAINFLGKLRANITVIINTNY